VKLVSDEIIWATIDRIRLQQENTPHDAFWSQSFPCPEPL
jgi:hypothetical protein